MNSKQGAVSFEYEGRTCALRFTTNAMVSYQDEMDETVIEGVQGLGDGGIDLRRMRALVWAGFEGAERLSLQEAGQVIDHIGLEKAGELIAKSVELAFPEASKSADVGNEQSRSGKKT